MIDRQFLRGILLALITELVAGMIAAYSPVGKKLNFGINQVSKAADALEDISKSMQRRCVEERWAK